MSKRSKCGSESRKKRREELTFSTLSADQFLRGRAEARVKRGKGAAKKRRA